MYDFVWIIVYNGSSGHMYLVVYCQAFRLSKPSEKTMAVSQKESSYLWVITGPGIKF